VKNIISDLNNYDILIEEDGDTLLVSYMNKSIYEENRTKEITDVVTYELNKFTGIIIRYYYGIR
jgi:hypothetical protein